MDQEIVEIEKAERQQNAVAYLVFETVEYGDDD